VILVVGGHSRNIGKTSVVANLIGSLLQYSWTAIKITQFGHGVCSSSGEDCECATDPDHPFALTRETDPASGTDTSRYLAAGASESLWLRTRAGELGFALPALRRVLDRSPDVIIESNSVIQFIRPDAYVVVLDPATQDFKASSRLYLDRADAFLLAGASRAEWPRIPARLLADRPTFHLGAGHSLPSEALEFVQLRHKVSLTVGR
jgi:hypothetical protein